MDRDEDLIRGVGYMVIQASHLERQIEAISNWFGTSFSRPKHHETARVSNKIKWCKDKIKELNDERLTDLDKLLDKATNLLHKRNKLVHGQIYFANNAPEKLVPSKKSDKERIILPSKAYDLAEKMYELHLRILSNNSFKILAALKGKMNA